MESQACFFFVPMHDYYIWTLFTFWVYLFHMVTCLNCSIVCLKEALLAYGKSLLHYLKEQFTPKKYNLVIIYLVEKVGWSFLALKTFKNISGDTQQNSVATFSLTAELSLGLSLQNI